METKESTEALISAFHCTWDAFPGIARLIDRQHRILASNFSQSLILCGFRGVLA